MEKSSAFHQRPKIKTMTAQEILKADLLDIVFNNRNKSYGAYTLRKFYEQRLGLSLLTAIGPLLLLLVILRPQKKVIPLLDEKKFYLATQVLPDFVPPPPPKPRPVVQQAPATASFTQRIEIVEQPRADVEMKPLEELADHAIGSTNTAGASPDPQSSTNGNGGEGPALAAPAPEPGSQFIAVEVAPEFPGGAAAWRNFLSRYLQVPEELAPGDTKKVLVQFQVAKDGSVEGLTILQSAGRAFDSEVLRVMKKMPKWKPALQNGQPVAVTFTQPVTFVGIE